MSNARSKKTAIDSAALSPRERVLHTATSLFYKHGVHSVGVDRIIAESGVAKMTFYRHFPSKARLISAYLAAREETWQQLVVRFSGDTSLPALDRLLSLFDALEFAIIHPGFYGCPFIKALAEFGPEHDDPKVRAQILAHFDATEKLVNQLLRQIAPKDAKKLVQPFLSLMTGALVVAHAGGGVDVARRNKELARMILSPEAVGQQGPRSAGV
ncbi:MAG TPA: TetR/AcrR family transcriptional regulator [Chthoniobacter sp.]|nr:TetR/AcrR family transcriptional regulator [Chthoniobacter sp.]